MQLLEKLNLGIDEIRLLFFLGFLALLLSLETFFPKRKWTSHRGRRLLFHFSVAGFNTLLLKTLAAVPFVIYLEWLNEKNFGLTSFLGLEGLSALIVGLIALDLFDYFWHRWNHTIPFLWRFHKVHHSDLDIDLSTSLRFHPGELFISALVKFVWVTLLGPSIWTFAVFEIGITLASQFHHSNLRLNGVLEKNLAFLTVTPRFHAHHHALETLRRGVNFSTMFSVWDRVFGTYLEEDQVATEFGTDDTYQTLNFVDVMKAPFKKSFPT
jgi:sterol desaturase/sphingolipid hydroxylase (fatty acid hydroxylase superfamily)